MPSVIKYFTLTHSPSFSQRWRFGGGLVLLVLKGEAQLKSTRKKDGHGG